MLVRIEDLAMDMNIFCKIEQDGEVLEYSVNKIENILKSFKEGMQEHIKKKMEWEQKSKIHISI